MTISGTAENREELIAFMRALQQDAQLEGVTIPVENLAGSNGVFTFTIVGTHI